MAESSISSNGRCGCRNVTAAHPCPVCGKPDWCSVSEDGEVCLCRRMGAPSQQRTDTNGDTYYLHRLRPGASNEPCFSLADGGGRLADPDTRHRVYTALLDALSLFDQDETALKARGLKDGLMAAGYRSLPERGRSRVVRRLIEAGLEKYLPTVPGFFVAERRGRYWTISGKPGLLIPVRDCQQRIVGLLVRPDKQTEGGKYRWLSSRPRGGPGPGAPIHVPLFQGDTAIVRVTEGALKADIATRLSGVLTIGLPGMNSGSRVPTILNELGAKVVRIAFDADARRNRVVAEALRKLVDKLRAKGFTVELESWEEAQGKGIDDLLATDHEPTVFRGDSVPAAIEAIACQASAATPGSSPPVDPAASGEHGLTALDIIREFLRTYYRPTFRRGPFLYSEALGREIRAAEACYAPTPRLVDDLEMASDCPRTEKGINRSAIPKLFKTWAPVAWRDVLDHLPEEEQTAEVVGSAAEQFREKVAAGLHTHITLGHATKDDKGRVTETERRSLISWVGLFAKPGPWKQIRNYLLWCRRDERGCLRVALRVGLFSSGQAYQRSLAEYSQYRFGQLCELYGVGTAKDAAGDGIRACGQRVVELAPEFLAELLAAPVTEAPEQATEQPRCREPGEEG